MVARAAAIVYEIQNRYVFYFCTYNLSCTLVNEFQARGDLSFLSSKASAEVHLMFMVRVEIPH